MIFMHCDTEFNSTQCNNLKYYFIGLFVFENHKKLFPTKYLNGKKYSNKYCLIIFLYFKNLFFLFNRFYAYY